MSADNKSNILQTKSKDGGSEFRVECIQNSERITDNPDTKDGFNNEAVLKIFGESKVFTKESDAWREAFKIEDEMGGSEYGAVRLDFSHLPFPEKVLV
ncbi:MAG: hypothetical protein NT068_02710 [Candidatus Nomurabacteria bacterium]|nr:hypothetical protein [Candidatus Nomurabacteria bacterium]